MNDYIELNQTFYFVNKRGENNNKNNKNQSNSELHENSNNFSCDNMLLVLTTIIPFSKLMLWLNDFKRHTGAP